jgi:cytochrome c-type biogenesis protein CcmH/NrfG
VKEIELSQLDWKVQYDGLHKLKEPSLSFPETSFFRALEIILLGLVVMSIAPAMASDRLLYRKEVAALAQARRSPSFENLRRLSEIRFGIAKSLAAKAHDDTSATAFRRFLLYADSAARLHPGTNGEHWILLGYGLLRIADVPHAPETSEDAFRAALRVTPWNERALAGLALALFAEKRYSEARAQWDTLFDALPEAVTGSRLVAYEASAVAAGELAEGYEGLTRLAPRLGEQDAVNEVRRHFCQGLYANTGQNKWRNCAMSSEAPKK